MRAKCLRTLVICAALIATYHGAAYCDDEEQQLGWKNELVTSLNLTQAAFDNWSQGGENVLAWQTNLLGRFTRHGERSEWRTGIKLEYGMTKTGDDDPRKTVDEIKIETVYNYKLRFAVDFYVAGAAETQFAKGYEYFDSSREVISDFLDPGCFTESAGISKSYGEALRSRFGFAAKQTIADNFARRYTDDPETSEKVEDVRSEVGVESVTDLNLKLNENLVFASNLDLFSNLDATNEIDVVWDNVLTAKVAPYVNVNLTIKLVYDRDISTKRQLKQSLALGLTYAIL